MNKDDVVYNYYAQKIKIMVGFRHGPFDILGGGGAWDILEKKFLALILTKKNKLAQWHSEKNNLSPIV